MAWHRRLRFRLIASQGIVVIVGVASLLLVLYLFVPSRLQTLIAAELTPIFASPSASEELARNLVMSVNRLMLVSIAIAAGFAGLAGIISALLLWRIIITPLRNIAESSRRIANGRYDERVPVPYEAGQAISILATNFNQMADALESVEATRMALIGNVTHELRTPLASLSGYIEGLADGIFELNDQTLRSMDLQIARLTRLVKDIQTLSRVESGSIELIMREHSIVEVVEQVTLLLEPNRIEKEMEIVTEYDGEDIEVIGDFDRIAQILINLVSNAIQYTPAGGKIDIRVSTVGRNCRIDVVDNGIGIPEEAVPFLFERFYRVDPSRSREQGGSGVGLTISRHLAWAMGGTLTVASQGKGRGSTFTLTLPLAR